MTREEAIICKAYLNDLDRTHDCNEYKFLMALLEKEPCGDCVSRQQALKELKESAEHHANDSREEALLRRDRDIIRALPPVTPTRKKGKWEYDAYKDKSGGHCNCCGHFLRYGEKTNFCPDCGAEMEVEE